jgi:hypothetical protein
MNAGFLDITPPAGPPAAGSRGGATNLPAGTTLGAPTGSPLVHGDNLFVPGMYQSLTSILITGDVTLDAQGNSSAVFIFQSSSTVGTAANAQILLVNGARASNVYWQAASSATLGIRFASATIEHVEKPVDSVPLPVDGSACLAFVFRCFPKCHVSSRLLALSSCGQGHTQNPVNDACIRSRLCQLLAISRKPAIQDAVGLGGITRVV